MRRRKPEPPDAATVLEKQLGIAQSELNVLRQDHYDLLGRLTRAEENAIKSQRIVEGHREFRSKLLVVRAALTNLSARLDDIVKENWP